MRCWGSVAAKPGRAPKYFSASAVWGERPYAEVVKQALAHNAAAAILAHNHRSDEAKPSHADELITLRLKDALGMVDIRVLIT